MVTYIFVTDWFHNNHITMRRDVFQAIADPKRREIIHLVADNSMHLNAIAQHFKVSRPAISKHIKILKECGLLTIQQEGRERFCTVQLDTLQEVADWMEPLKIFWSNKLDALELHLRKKKKKAKKHHKHKKK